MHLKNDTSPPESAKLENYICSTHHLRFVIAFDLQVRVCFGYALIALLRLFCCIVFVKKQQ